MSAKHVPGLTVVREPLPRERYLWKPPAPQHMLSRCYEERLGGPPVNMFCVLPTRSAFSILHLLF